MALKFDPNNPNYVYIIDYDTANKALEDLEKQKMIGVDTECTSLDPYSSKMLVVQIGTEEISYIFDSRALDLANFPRFKDLLEDTTRVKMLHNAKFDYKQIKHAFNIELANIYDTMLAEVVLNAGVGKAFYGLKALALKYAELEMKKEVRETFENVTPNMRLSEDQLKYSALDTLILFPIVEKQLQELAKHELLNIAKLEFAATRVVGDMELQGVYINQERWKGVVVALQNRRNELAKQFQEAVRPYYKMTQVDLFGVTADAINMNSQQQLLDLLNNRLKLNLPATGDAILATANHPVVTLLREYRKYEKLISAFGDSLLAKINKVTNRIHPEFNQLGAATGRFSCNNPNLQQIPHNSAEVPFRECFNPKPGYKFVVADYSSMEMRILACLSKDAKLVQAVKESDVHSFTAALMFGKEYSKDFKKLYPDLRQAAKAINFGLMYGMGAASLARQINVTVEQGEEYMKRYFQNFPGVQKFLDGMANDAVRYGFSKTPAGRKRWYHVPERSDPEYRKKCGSIGREAKNHPIQGTNADAIKFALVYLKDRMKKEGIDGSVLMTIHDEVVSEIREDQAEYWATAQSEEMVRAANLFVKDVGIKADPFVGDVWEH
jgi:DNA polymerase I